VKAVEVGAALVAGVALGMPLGGALTALTWSRVRSHRWFSRELPAQYSIRPTPAVLPPVQASPVLFDPADSVVSISGPGVSIGGGPRVWVRNSDPPGQVWVNGVAVQVVWLSELHRPPIPIPRTPYVAYVPDGWPRTCGRFAMRLDTCGVCSCCERVRDLHSRDRRIATGCSCTSGGTAGCSCRMCRYLTAQSRLTSLG
jgi:hypothetical protein